MIRNRMFPVYDTFDDRLKSDRLRQRHAPTTTAAAAAAVVGHVGAARADAVPTSTSTFSRSVRFIASSSSSDKHDYDGDKVVESDSIFGSSIVDGPTASPPSPAHQALRKVSFKASKPSDDYDRQESNLQKQERPPVTVIYDSSLEKQLRRQGESSSPKEGNGTQVVCMAKRERSPQDLRTQMMQSMEELRLHDEYDDELDEYEGDYDYDYDYEYHDDEEQWYRQKEYEYQQTLLRNQREFYRRNIDRDTSMDSRVYFDDEFRFVDQLEYLEDFRCGAAAPKMLAVSDNDDDDDGDNIRAAYNCLPLSSSRTSSTSPKTKTITATPDEVDVLPSSPTIASVNNLQSEQEVANGQAGMISLLPPESKIQLMLATIGHGGKKIQEFFDPVACISNDLGSFLLECGHKDSYLLEEERTLIDSSAPTCFVAREDTTRRTGTACGNEDATRDDLRKGDTKTRFYKQSKPSKTNREVVDSATEAPQTPETSKKVSDLIVKEKQPTDTSARMVVQPSPKEASAGERNQKIEMAKIPNFHYVGFTSPGVPNGSPQPPPREIEKTRKCIAVPRWLKRIRSKDSDQHAKIDMVLCFLTL